MDPHCFWKLHPDPPYSEKLDPGPHYSEKLEKLDPVARFMSFLGSKWSRGRSK
jgi:hypothetical protein